MTTKINPFVQIFEAFRGFTFTGAFYNLRKQSTGSKIAYSIIISIFTGLLLCALEAVSLITDKELNQFMNDLPEFYYSNGEFYCEDRFEESASGTYMLIDTSQTQFTQNHIKSALTDSNITGVLLISKTNIITYKTLTAEYQEMKLSDFMNVFQIQSLSKQQILSEYKGFIFKIAMIISLGVIPFQFVKLFFVSLILALIALIINVACSSKESFPTLYWISFYIQSVFMIILAIGKPFLSLSGSSFTIACLLFFIIIMYLTLKHGEPVIKPIMSSNYNDDFDNFMRQDADMAPTSSPSAFDNTNTASSSTSFDTTDFNTEPSYGSANTYTEPSYNNTDTMNPSEPPKSSSGLSLKKED